MSILSDLRSLTKHQRAAFMASYLGWTLDAFDFFLMAFTYSEIAKDFGVDVKTVAFATMLTLIGRPLGALVFGALADRFGRRPILMLDIALYALLELATAFSPNLTVFFILRTLFGIAMGGEWGIGASLTMESIPPRMRGLCSGILQQGYPVGFLLAGIAIQLLLPSLGWRGMMAIGALPALLVFYIGFAVEESPVWKAGQAKKERPSLLSVLGSHWQLLVYVVILMMCFNFFSHGSQDMYPQFLEKSRHLSLTARTIVTDIGNIGAIIGGILFGMWSDKIGRRRAIVIAALLALPFIPLWAFSTTPVWLAVGAFTMQFAVQGAWGVIPTHLNELSPNIVRGVFPGLAYQLGNLLASYNGPLQAGWAESRAASTGAPDYSVPMATVIGIVAVAIAVLAAFGVEKRGVDFNTESDV